jgi:hypothetical protein
MSLAGDVARRSGTTRGIAIDFDRDADRCFYSIDVEGRDSAVVWSIPRDHETHKRFNPLDVSQRVAALAASPDGRTVALRFGPPGALSPAVLYDLETEHTILVAPGERSRQVWLSILVDTASRLLHSALPPAVVDGHPALRPGLLPLPGELPAPSDLPLRLSRIARLGSSLCPPPRTGLAPAAVGEAAAIDTEARLFFSYLQGDFKAAAAELDSLDGQFADSEKRLALLSLRAQILWSAGRQAEARAVAAYLLSNVGFDTRRIEETPLGLVVTTEVSPGQAWARYLSARAAIEPAPETGTREDPSGGLAEPKPLDPFDALDFRGLEVGGEALPFGPAARALVEELPRGPDGRPAGRRPPDRPRQ